MERILEEVDRLDKECKEIKYEIYKLIWYMRGAISLTEGFELSLEDRQIINDLVKENLETTKKTKLPFF